MKKSYFIAGAAVAIALVTVITVSQSVFAHSNKYQEKSFDNHKQFTAENKAEFIAEKKIRMESVKAALESENYTAWVDAMGDGAPMLEQVNEQNFSRFIEAHNYMEKARVIFEELGVEKPGENMGEIRGFIHKSFNR